MILQDYAFFLPHFPDENEETKSAYRRSKDKTPGFLNQKSLVSY
jgi:hypothetical protein